MPRLGSGPICGALGRFSDLALLLLQGLKANQQPPIEIESFAFGSFGFENRSR